MTEKRVARGPFQVKRMALPAAFEAASLGRHSLDEAGTDALTGLSGSMRINIDKGQHAYEFEYAIKS